MTGLGDELRTAAIGIRLGQPFRNAALLERAADALSSSLSSFEAGVGLTLRQRDTMLFLQRASDETGVIPSFDEIANAIGLKSKAGVQRLVLGLEERGYLRRIPYKSRSLAILRRVPDHSEPAPKADPAKASARKDRDAAAFTASRSPAIAMTSTALTRTAFLPGRDEEPELPRFLDRRVHG